MTGPLASLSTLLVSAVLVGAAVDTSWILGVPLLVGLCGVVGWSCDCIDRWQKDNGESLEAATVSLSLIIGLCIVSGIASAFYFPFALNTLNIVLLSAISPHCQLLYTEAPKRVIHYPLLIAICTPLTLIGVATTGLSYDISWSATVPGAVLLTYSLFLLGRGLFEAKLLKSAVSIIVCLVILIATIVPTFTTYFYAPLWTPPAIIGTCCAFLLVLLADFEADGTLVSHGGCGALLQLVSAAAAGVAIAADMPISWIGVCAGGLIPSNVSMAIRLGGKKQWPDKNQPSTLSVQHRRLRIIALVFLVGLIVALLITFHFTHEATPSLVPFIFVGLAVLCTAVIQIIYRFEPRCRASLLAAISLVLCASYCSMMAAALLGNSYNDDEEGRKPWRVHAIATAILSAFAVHVFALACSKSAQRELQKRQPISANAPLAGASAERLAGPLTSLLILIVCSILGGVASWVSWMAAVPMLIVFGATACWTCYCMGWIDTIFYRIVASIAYLLLVTSTAMIFVAYFYWQHLCAVFTLSAVAYAAVLFSVECNAIGITEGILRVTCVLQLLVAAATGVTIATKIPIACFKACIGVLALNTIINSSSYCRTYYDNSLNGVVMPSVRRPRLQIVALFFIVGLVTALLLSFQYLHKAYPVLIPFILAGIAALHLFAVYIIDQLKEQMKYHGRAGCLLSLLFLYLIYVAYRLKIDKNEWMKTEFTLMTLVGALAFHMLAYSFTLFAVEEDMKAQKPIRRCARVPCVPVVAAVAAAAPTATVERKWTTDV